MFVLDQVPCCFVRSLAASNLQLATDPLETRPLEPPTGHTKQPAHINRLLLAARMRVSKSDSVLVAANDRRRLQIDAKKHKMPGTASQNI